MAELKNNFCWSFSQSKDFQDCPRRHYWNRYGFWGGWNSSASPESRTAYRLKQMSNKWSLIGNAVDQSITEIVHRVAVGADATYEMALENANTFLRNAWMQHCSGNWRTNPKYSICIRDVYYNEISTEPSIARDNWAEAVKDRTERCLANFFETVLPRLEDLKYNAFLPVDHPGSGDPEHFFIGQVKVYAIPDCAFNLNGVTQILDWKTGKQRDSHHQQIKIYGLWAQTKLNIPGPNIKLYLEYLEDGISTPVEYSDQHAHDMCAYINDSVQKMRTYLVNGDIATNQACPMADFEQTDNLYKCKQCNYIELCQRQDAFTI